MHADVVVENAGPPFYTIAANGPWVPNDGGWAVFPFLRELGCVPDDVNLFAIVGPMAFGCTATIAGHEHWENGPGIDLAPRQTVFRGLGAVPIVFALLTDVEAVIGDGELTLPELFALPSVIVGTAHFYKEIDILGISGPHGAGRGMYKIKRAGRPDRRRFVPAPSERGPGRTEGGSDRVLIVTTLPGVENRRRVPELP